MISVPLSHLKGRADDLLKIAPAPLSIVLSSRHGSRRALVRDLLLAARDHEGFVCNI